MVSIVIAAGGTGGHIYPGLALAEAIRKAQPEARITFVGTPRGLEGALIPKAGYQLRLVNMLPFTGWRKVTTPYTLWRAAREAAAVLREVDADAVAGMGGYPSVPPVMAARRMRIPSLVHEPGAVGGRANKLAARYTDNVALAFAPAAAAFPRHRTRLVGLPLSGELVSFERAPIRTAARQRYGVGDGVALVVVNGGSQGSVRLNGLAADLSRRWAGRDDVHLVVKAGRAHADSVAAAIDTSVATCVTYFDHMPSTYAAADLMICRGGAATVAELAITGVPAIVVPYPHQPVVKEQTANARVLVDAGAATIVADERANADVVGPMVEDLLANRDRLIRMVDAARHEARPAAAADLAAWVLELAALGKG